MVSSGSAPAEEQLWVEVPTPLFSDSVHPSVPSETLLTFELLSKHGQEDGEVDGPRSLLQHLIQLLLLHV